MPGHDIIVIGASAGGVEALSTVVARLPCDLPAALFVVLHIPRDGVSLLPQILSRAGPLPAVHPRDGEPIAPARIYVAPPDQHLLVIRDQVRLVRGPRENGHRPAVDPLFRTAARAFGPRVVGVVLSGALDDGTAGLVAVKRQGGIAVVQQPADAAYAGMPQSALSQVVVDHCLPAAEIADVLVTLAHEVVDERPARAVAPDLDMEIGAAVLDSAVLESEGRPGRASVFTCPECHGNLWEMQDGELVRFRCRVGHAYSAETLLEEQSGALEGALWAALRALEEKSALARRLARRAAEQGHTLVVERFEEQEADARQRARLLRDALLTTENPRLDEVAAHHRVPEVVDEATDESA
jgi:two-component system chemotaxis response regulator CheB